MGRTPPAERRKEMKTRAVVNPEMREMTGAASGLRYFMNYTANSPREKRGNGAENDSHWLVSAEQEVVTEQKETACFCNDNSPPEGLRKMRQPFSDAMRTASLRER